MNVDEVSALAARVRAEIGKAIVGQTETVDLLLTALFARGHVLLEGAPGTAKTFLAQCFAQTLALQFGRIQFTPDLMPADIVGANLFNFQTSSFTLSQGPVFCICCSPTKSTAPRPRPRPPCSRPCRSAR